MDWLDSEEFGVLLMAYRMCPGWHQPHMNDAVQKIASAIRLHQHEIAPVSEDAKHEGEWYAAREK